MLMQFVLRAWPEGALACGESAVDNPSSVGGALNPARALGPSIVFNCRWQETWIYVVGEIVGGVLGGICSLPLYGRGKDFMKLTRIGTISGSIPKSQPNSMQHFSQLRYARNEIVRTSSSKVLSPCAIATYVLKSARHRWEDPISPVLHRSGGQRSVK